MMKKFFVKPAACLIAAVLALSGCPMGGDDEDDSLLPPPPPTALEAPGKPGATGGDRQLAVSWAQVAGAAAYEVWYAPAAAEPDPGAAERYVESVSALSLVITGLDNETFYYVWIKAKNADGTSDFSEPVKESPKAPLAPPPKPAILEPAPEGVFLRVRWTALPQADGYEVYYTGPGAPPGTPPALASGGGTDSALIPDLEADTTYYVWVRARNAAGVSEDSAVKSCATYKSARAVTAFAVGAVAGSINEGAKTIALLVPYTANLQELTPLITLSPDATVSPASATPVNFSGGPVDFTVTAQNGTTQAYQVTVTKKGQGSFALAWKPGEGFVDAGQGAFTAEALTLVKSGQSTADIELSGSFATYEWYVDSALQGQGSGGAAAVSLDAQDYFTGNHRLDIVVYDADGVPYAKGLSFTVTD